MPPDFTRHFTFEAKGVDRLDRLLASQFPTCSRAYFQHLIRTRSVSINGDLAKKGRRIEIGDRIEVVFPPLEEIDLMPEFIPLDVLFEDEHVICVNKPAGMVVHPSPGHFKGTFVHALLHHCRGISLPGEGHRPGIVHRLDKETSGILLAAKSPKAYRGLIIQFKKRMIAKKYVAITVGHPTAREIHASIGRDPLCRKKMAVSEKGREATTVITPLARGHNFSLIAARLLTGRTHQIRVHLKYNRTPILGDSTYGLAKVNSRYQVARQQLHAAHIRFLHPIKDEILSFSAPLPPDMKKRSEDFFSSSLTLSHLPIF